MQVLVTGTSSGLGRALHRAFGASAFVRAEGSGEGARYDTVAWDLIVHCATDARKAVPAADLEAYHDSHVELTRRLLGLPHRQFVFVSSQAVYPGDGRAWREDDLLQADDRLSLYGIFKLLTERLVLSRATRPLILRTSSLVGPEGRPNNIMRILRREPGRVALSADCPYNLIAYSQVEAFVRESLARHRSGIFNLGATDERSLGEIAAHVGVDISFGDVRYTAPRADLSALHGTTRIFDHATLDVADLVARQMAGTTTR